MPRSRLPSSSSSSDANEKLLEAIDPDHLKAFKNKAPAHKSDEVDVLQQKASLRRDKRDDNRPVSGYDNITKEFQEFIGKKLSEILDKSLKVRSAHIDGQSATSASASGGIRLFHDSSELLLAEDEQEPSEPSRKRKRPDLLKHRKDGKKKKKIKDEKRVQEKGENNPMDSSSSEDENAFREAAVSVDQILQHRIA